MRSNFRVTTQRSYWDWTEDAYEYPDINDIIDQEERLKEEKRARKRGKKPEKPMDVQNIKIRLVLGQFVSKEELNYLYQHSTVFEVAELDRLFGGSISAAGLGRKSDRGIDHGYHEGYTSDVVEVNGRRTLVMIPTSSPDLNVDANSVNKLHSVVDVLQNNIHEDFGQAVCCAIRKFPQDVRKVLNEADAIDIRYVGCEFMRVESTWDQRLDAFKVDVIVNAEVAARIPAVHNPGCVSSDNVLLVYKEVSRHIIYRLRYTLDLYGKTGVKTCSGPSVMPAMLFPPDIITMQKTWRTTSYLRPIIWRKDFPRLIRRMLSEVYPEALERPTAIDGDELVERMSEWLNRKYPGMRLRVREAWLGQNGIRGQIYFADKKTIDHEGEPVEFKAGDIVINMDYIDEDWDRHSAIIHECLHVYLHLPFFMLQMMAGNPDYSYTDRVSDGGASNGASGEMKLETAAERDHLKWMEWQAEKMTPYVMMEESMVRQECARLLALCGGRSTTENLNWIMNRLSATFETSKQMSKIRMVEVDIKEANGIWNFVSSKNGGKKKLPDFCAGPQRKDGAVYYIDAEAARELYLRSEEFARVIESCKYVYLEGHYVLDKPKYVKMDSRFRRYLTPYARKNIAECSLSFRIITKDSKIDYVFGAAAKSDKRAEYFDGYTFSAEPDTTAREKENEAYGECSDRWCALAASFPEDNPGEAIKIAMKAMGVTQDVLASHLGVVRKTLNEWLKEKEMPVGRVVGICVVLGMRMDVSEALIEAAARPLKRSGVDALYRSFIATPGAITIARCNEILIAHNYPALNEGLNTEGMADCQLTQVAQLAC